MEKNLNIIESGYCRQSYTVFYRVLFTNAKTGVQSKDIIIIKQKRIVLTSGDGGRAGRGSVTGVGHGRPSEGMAVFCVLA